MTWEKFNDDGYFDCIMLKEANIFLAKKQVMFGWRLVGGDIKDVRVYSHLDLCCGNDHQAYMWLKSAIMLLISYNYISDPKKDVFRDIPSVSAIKPYPNDDNFCAIIHLLLNRAVQLFSPNSCLEPYELNN